MKLRLDVVMQENEVEEANRDGLTVTGQSVRAVRRVEPGKMVRVVLKREADGTDREWLELTVREPAAEADELPMPRKVGPAATEALPPDEFNPAHFNQAPARPAPAASPSTAR
jgi:hypothetical protein